jgi:phosphoserine phosphatase RsbU/P
MQKAGNRMRKLTRLLLLLIALLFAAQASLRAQAFDLDKDRLPIVSLNGLWRFHTGDNPAWADPNFDDSGWSLLKSDRDWGQQGYKGYSGMGWYRFQILVPARVEHISFALPQIETSYEVFSDGVLIGSYGKMPPHSEIDYFGWDNLLYKIPAARGVRTTGLRKVSIAIRVWQWPHLAAYYGGGPQTGGGISGDSSLLKERRNLNLARDFTDQASDEILALLSALAAIGALALYLVRRKEPEYLWFGLRMGIVAIWGWIDCSIHWHVWGYQTYQLAYSAKDVANTLLYIAFFVQMLQPRRGWLLKAAVVCALLEIPNYTMMYVFPEVVSPLITSPLDDLLTLGSTIWILVTLFSTAWQKSKDNSRWLDARLLVVPFLLRTSENWLNQANSVVYFINRHSPFLNARSTFLFRSPFPITLANVIQLLWLVSVFVVLVLRFARTSREQERYATEVQGARSVQQFLIPEDLPKIPGLIIESDYRPAREVGGDFFQIIPDPKDGGALIVVGDVAGKGMQAGMLATLLVGSMRTAATFTTDPAVILSTLNNRLHGKGNATCLALHIDSSGSATLVNAGHLPPYRNGQELPMEGALPLGTIPNNDFPILHFQLAEGDNLTLITDGILEAQKPDGELFGFGRITAQLRQSTSATNLATAAQSFGQEDDITVLTIARLAEAAV